MTRTNKQMQLVIGGLCLVGMVVVGWGLFGLYRDLNKVTPYTVIPGTVSESTASAGEETTQVIIVDIGGAVQRPGVYELQNGARLAEVVELAGGFSDEVDKEYLNKRLNLSTVVKDMEKIYIPQSGEGLEGGENATLASESSNTASQGISINNASQKELQTLSGIGEVRAQAIISGRPYSSVTELVERGILTEKIFANIKEEITL